MLMDFDEKVDRKAKTGVILLNSKKERLLRTLEKQDVMTPLCPRSNDPPMFVSDLIHAATRPWNMEVVREHMYEMDAEAVANIPISHVAQPERMEEDFSYHIRTDLTGSVSHSNIMTVSLAPSYLLETGISWCSTAYSAFPGTGIDR